MKAHVLAAFLLPTLVPAQLDYLANNPVWTVTASCNKQGWGGGPCITTDTYNYQLAGDTVINGTTYSRVVRSGSVDHMWMGTWPPPNTCMGTTVYTGEAGGLLRQQDQAFYMWSGAEDMLLFDFDLAVGELLPLSANNYNDQIVVTAVDSVEMNGAWRHRFTVEGDWSQTIIEGVGSDHGLFEPVSAVFECGYMLDCFGLNGSAAYPAPGPDCDLHTGAAEQVSAGFGIGFNPTTAILKLQLPERSGAWPLDLVDAQGRFCLRTTVSGRTAQLSLASLPNGTYVICVGAHRNRLVVMRD